MKRVLIIGGSRFIGRKIVDRLLDRRDYVTVLNRGSKPIEGTAQITGDRNQEGFIDKAVQEVRPDIVIDMLLMNEEQAKTTLDACALRCPLLAISSCDVYRNFGGVLGRDTVEPDPTPLTEDSPLRDSRYPYRTEDKEKDGFRHDYDKILVEKLIMSDGRVPASVLRLPMVYGPEDFQHRFYDYAKRMADGRPYILIPQSMAEWMACRGYIDTMADAALAVADLLPKVRNTFHACDQPALSEVNFAREIAKAMNWSGEVRIVPDEELWEERRHSNHFNYNIALDTSRLEAASDWKPVRDFAERFKATCEWELANPPEGWTGDYDKEDELAKKIGLVKEPVKEEKKLVIYVTAGDPDLDQLPDILTALQLGGADVVEVGIPFSDPIADGPTIQASSQRALDRGVTPKAVLAKLKEAKVKLPLVLMGYMNPIMAMGFENFAIEAKQAGVGGVIVCDLIPGPDADEWKSIADKHGIDTIFLAAPTSTEERLKLAAESSSGFVYAVSRTGVTGAASQVSEGSRQVVNSLRKYTDIPIFVGFGISTAEHVKMVCEFADGAVVGSRIVDLISRHWNEPGGKQVLIDTVKSLKEACR